jgi:RNA polymerase sigma-70 factor (family 1)
VLEPEITIHDFKSGDTETFEQVFHAYYKALAIYAKTILKDMDDAEDIVQQVYIGIWEKRAKLEVHTSLRALLYKSVHNACLNKIKQQTVRTKYAAEVLYQVQEGKTDDGLQQKELQKKIEQALNALPEQCGKIFRMSRFEHLKYQEIADQLGLSVKTVENQMGRALKIMKTHLKDYLPVVLLIISNYYLD